MNLSIILPAYNEATRLKPTLGVILEFLSQRPRLQAEIIVVDDGSTDRTAEIAQAFGPAVQLLRRPHLGKGGAVQAGVLASRGDLILLTDTDLSTPIETLDRFLDLIKDREIVIGSRALPDSQITRSQVWYKVWLGRLGNLAIRWLAVPGIHDTQCGFKLFTKRCQSLFKKQRLSGWGFDFEILFLAHKSGYRVLEAPVEWRNNTASKVRPLDYLKTMRELLVIRWNYYRGLYR